MVLVQFGAGSYSFRPAPAGWEKELRLKNGLLPRALSFALLGGHLVGCQGQGGGEGEFSAGLQLVSTNVTPGQVWFVNAPIEFRFNKPIDLSSASFASIAVVPAPAAVASAPVAGPAQGDLFLRAGSFERTLVFQPLCPTDPGFRNGGLVPGNAFGGVLYSVTVYGADSTTGLVVRGQDGSRLANSISFTFETPTSYPLLDPNPFGPPSVVQETPLPPVLGPNLLINPNPPLTIVLDQPVKADSIGNDSVRLEFTHPSTGRAARIPASVTLAENCNPSGQAVLQVVPFGILPSGLQVRLFLSTKVEGFGKDDRSAADVLIHSARVEGPRGRPQRDALLERFEDPSRADPAPELPQPLAQWGGGILQAAPIFPGAGSDLEIEIGPGTANGEDVVFSTDGGTLRDKNGVAVHFPNGVIEAGSFTLKSPPAGRSSTFQATGSLPVVIRCRRSFTVGRDALLMVKGQRAQDVGNLNSPQIPAPPGEGRCGGGVGGPGSPVVTESDEKGGDGAGPFNVPGQGGRGGHSGYGSNSSTANRPGGRGAGIGARRS